jgi:hypothetical protein
LTDSHHFSDEDWADFTRGVADSHRRAAMQRHLEEGCQRCAGLHDSLAAVQAAAAADRRYEPPAGTVRRAKALYEFRGQVSPFARALETVKLLFDSQVAPLAAGVRSSPGGPRKLLFASGDLVIDLQIAPGHQPRHTEIIGQISAPPHLAGRKASQPIVLRRGGLSVADATTNKRGEFQIEFAGPFEELTLTLGADREMTVITLETLTRTQS